MSKLDPTKMKDWEIENVRVMLQIIIDKLDITM